MRRGHLRWRHQGLLPLTLIFAFSLVAASFAPSASARLAYVLNAEANNLSLIDTATNLVVGSPVAAGVIPQGIAIAPDGKFAYLSHTGTNVVTRFDTQTNQSVGSPIPVGEAPLGIAFTPDGRFAYVANVNSSTISVIDTQTDQVIGSPIMPGLNPDRVAITADGARAYVDNSGSDSVSVIDTQTNQVIGSPITVGSAPVDVALTPDGLRLYVVNEGNGITPGSISVIDTTTNTVIGSPIPVGVLPTSLAITPDGRFAYVANGASNSVSVIETQTNKVVGSPITVGKAPRSIAISPNGEIAYVSNFISETVSVINTETNQVIGSPMVGKGTEGIAITPDQPPLASFSATRARPRVPVSFNGSASSDSDGTISVYAWRFGDGSKAAGSPTERHTYARPGSYQVTLTLTDEEGCSTSFLSTGATAYCNGGPAAARTRIIRVAYPGVRVKCPRRSKPGGCRFKLQAISGKPRKGGRKPRALSALARVKVRPGQSAIASVKPKRSFAAKLARAKKVLVRETTTIASKTHTYYRRLRIVR